MLSSVEALSGGKGTRVLARARHDGVPTWLKVLSLLLTICLVPTGVRAAGKPQIWFFMTNYDATPGSEGREGWDRLFAGTDRPWPEVMKSVKVIAAGKVEEVPDNVLKRMFVRLRQHHVSFAVEILAQNWFGEAPCGHGVESYSDPAGAAKLAAKIKAAGGRIDHIMMDEPLFYGHYYDGVNACHSTIDNVARRAARLVSEYTKVFPDVIIGDTEPVPAIASTRDWQGTYRSWLSAFRAASSRPITVTHLDVDWDKPSWQGNVRSVLSFLSATNIRTGIIYNASATGTQSSGAWFCSAVKNITVAGRHGLAPDDAIFQSWTRFPGRSFSDSHGQGEDYLLKRYLQIRAGSHQP